ncbi:MAG: DUF475 domain-containing protein [Gammaproteobacteria bacterium]|nr:DUF475 domain-containing protein [Gammaproteobacteria bacterium]
MSGNLRFFTGSFIVTLVGAVAAFLIGGVEALFLVAVLSVLEISLSFDNAVVNATVLKEMSPKWQRRFLTWGMVIAVFGMRILFPVIIVSIIARVSPWEAINIAMNSPETYAHHMELAHINLMGFGGSFLLMVGLDFFLDDEKEHWIPLIEKPIMALGKIPYMTVLLTAGLILSVAYGALQEADRHGFIASALSGIFTYLAIHSLAKWMENREAQRATAGLAAKSGVAMFMYLEILDASFSFDGVIGAFAITTDLFIIAIGLGIGAMFVRSLTIMLVEKGTLSIYKYLEHGAFYAIIALAVIMILKTFMHIPEVLTGLIGAGFIGASFGHSWLIKQRTEAA